MKNIIDIFYRTLFILVFLSSCSNEEVDEIYIEGSNSNSRSYDSYNSTSLENRKHFALALHQAIQNVTFKNVLIELCRQSQLTEKNEIILASLVNNSFESEGVDSYLMNYLDIVTGENGTLTNLLKYDPGLAIYFHEPTGYSGDFSETLITYDVLNSGDHPFNVVNHEGIFEEIQFDDFDYSKPFFALKSQEHLIAFPKLSGLLESDYTKLEGAQELFENDYYTYIHKSELFEDPTSSWGEGEDRGPEGYTCLCEIDRDNDGFCGEYRDDQCFDPNDYDFCIPKWNPRYCRYDEDDGNEEPDIEIVITTSSRDGHSCEDPIRSTRQEREELVKLKFRNMKEFRKAERYGNPEIRVTAILYLNDAENNEFPPEWRVLTISKDIEDKRNKFKHWFDPVWYNYRDENGAPLLFQKWPEPPASANYMTWVFHETDKLDGKDDKIKVSTQITSSQDITDGQSTTSTSTVEAEIDVSKDAHELGTDLSYYCDNPNGEGKLYNTGKIFFHVKENEN